LKSGKRGEPPEHTTYLRDTAVILKHRKGLGGGGGGRVKALTCCTKRCQCPVLRNGLFKGGGRYTTSRGDFLMEKVRLDPTRGVQIPRDEG